MCDKQYVPYWYLYLYLLILTYGRIPSAPYTRYVRTQLVRCGAVRCGAVRCGAVLRGAARCCAVLRCAVQYYAIAYNTTQWHTIIDSLLLLKQALCYRHHHINATLRSALMTQVRAADGGDEALIRLAEGGFLLREPDGAVSASQPAGPALQA